MHQPSSNTKIIAIIIAVIAVVVVVVIVLAIILPILFPKQATANVSVCSTHWTDTISFSLYSNDKLIKSGSLSPYACASYSITETWSGSSINTVQYRAISQGGSSGSETDSEYVSFYENSYRTVTLYV